VDALDDDIAAAQAEQVGHMTRAQLRTLIDLLGLARSGE
jgi:hypothetical protein